MSLGAKDMRKQSDDIEGKELDVQKEDIGELNVALLEASYRGDVDEIIKLIAKGANIDAVDKSGATSLYLAAMKNRTEAIRVLVEHGINIESVDRNGLTALQIAAYSGNVEATAILIKLGANIEATLPSGHTPLHLAAMKSQFKVVITLVENSAIVNATTTSGFTAIDLAAISNSRDIVDFLMVNGGDIERINPAQTNVVRLAKHAAAKHTPLSKYLKEKIGLNQGFLQNIYNRFRDFIISQKSIAEAIGKKIIILIGEIHGDYKVYQVEKRLIRAISEAGIEYLYQEMPYEDITDVFKIATEKYGMKIKAIDTHPEHSTANTSERNKHMQKGIYDEDKTACLVTGTAHLQGFLEKEDEKIDRDRFYIVPVNLTHLVKGHEEIKKDPDSFERLQFSENPVNAIQILKPGENLSDQECFSSLSDVIEKWNGIGSRLN